MSTSTYVGIGRRDAINGLDLTDDEWGRFKTATLDAVEDHCGTAFFVGDGLGRWGDVSEESFMIVAGQPENLPGLKFALSRIAGEFDQEAIAIAVTEPTFVGPELWNVAREVMIRHNAKIDEAWRAYNEAQRADTEAWLEYDEMYGEAQDEV